MRDFLARLTVRDFIAVELSTSLVALTFVLALRAPESDAFKVLLGAILTVGFSSAIGWDFNSSAGSDKKDEIIASNAAVIASSAPVTTTKTEAPDGTTTTKTEPAPPPIPTAEDMKRLFPEGAKP